MRDYTWNQIIFTLIFPAFLATLKMLLISGIIATFFGFFIGATNGY